MRIYHAEPPRRRRRWLRVLVWTLSIILLLAAAAVGGVYLYLQEKVATLTAADTPDARAVVSALGETAPPLPNQPAIFMVLGYDARLGDKTSRSDTIMLIRLDPQQKVMTTMSFSRDLLVQIPGHGTQQINAAYEIGGAALALQTVRELTNLPINFLVPVNFKGFRQTVDEFDGVYVDVERRFFNDRGGPGGYAVIDLKPGYQRLTGTRALDYARYRHSDTDVHRAARQQAFISEFKKRVGGWNAAKNLPGLLDVLADNVRVLGPKGGEMNIDQMYKYANLIRRMPRENVISIRPEVTAAPSDPNRVVFANESALADAVEQFRNPDLDAVAETSAQDIRGAGREGPEEEGAGLPAGPRPRRRPQRQRRGRIGRRRSLRARPGGLEGRGGGRGGRGRSPRLLQHDGLLRHRAGVAGGRGRPGAHVRRRRGAAIHARDAAPPGVDRAGRP
jgi:LCP family protein required for cell wall assembly